MAQNEHLAHPFPPYGSVISTTTSALGMLTAEGRRVTKCEINHENNSTPLRG